MMVVLIWLRVIKTSSLVSIFLIFIVGDSYFDFFFLKKINFIILCFDLFNSPATFKWIRIKSIHKGCGIG